MENKNDHLKFLIQRYDNYISASNTKGNFLLAFNTLITGGILSNYEKFKLYIHYDNGIIWMNILLLLLSVICVFTIFLVIRAVYPFLKSGNSSINKYHSHIYFGSVAEFKDIKSFHDSFSSQTNDDVDFDLSNQVFELAKGLKKKFFYLEWAMRLIYIELILILLIITIFIIF